MKFSNIIPMLLLVIFVSTTASCAIETRSPTTGVSVAHVRIVKAQELVFLYEGKLDACGINYTADIVRSYKGNLKQKRLVFSSSSSLLVGQEYILIVGRDTDSPSLIGDWPKDYDDVLSECEKSLHDLSLQESDALMVWDYPYGLDGKWVMISDDNLLVKKHLAVKKGQCFYREGECSFINLETFVEEIVPLY